MIEYFDTFAPFGSLGGPGDPWVIGAGGDPLALQAHLGTDLLLIAEPLEPGSEGSLELDLFPPFGSLQEGWSAVTEERRTIWVAATQGRSTANDDEPPAQYVPGRLQPFNFGARLFEGTDPLSRSSANEGVLGLIDPDNTLYDLVGRVWDGTPITLKRGPRGTPFKDWPVVGRYRSAGLIRDLDQKQIQLRDLGWLFAGNLHDETYGGTGGVEGTADITGRIKPWAFGYCSQIEPVLLSGPDQIFQWSLSSSQALLELRHGGIPITIAADYPDYATLAAATIPSGDCATCLALSLVRPNLALQYDIRVDVIGDADVVNGHPAPLTRAAIARRIATARGENRIDDVSEIDGSSFARMEAFHTAPVGWYFGDQISKADAMNRVLAGILGWWRVRPDGRLSIGWVVAPESLTATITLTGGKDDVGKPRLVSTSAPRRGTRISWQTNNGPQDRSSLSPLVSNEDADRFKQPANYAQSLAPGVASTWPTAGLVTIDFAGFRDESAAVAEAARHQDIFSVERNRYARNIQIDPFIDLLGAGVGIASDPLLNGGSSTQLCVAIEATGTSVQTLEFFT